MNGISRIQSHITNKAFWQNCLLFVTDNASFSKTHIDFLEYHFIRFFDESNYMLENKDKRSNKPNISDFEEPALLELATQIEFLLACQGIRAQNKKVKTLKNQIIYPAIGKYKAQLIIKDGEFILLKGSLINKPSEKLKEATRKNAYFRQMRPYQELLEKGKIKELSDDIAETLVDLSFNTYRRSC